MAQKHEDPAYKESFRPDASALDREIADALGDLSIEDLYEKPTSTAPKTAADQPTARAGKQIRVGRVVRVSKDDVFVDFGGKSQGVVQAIQFEELPEIGTQIELMVDRYDDREGLLILSVPGHLNTDVTWENLEVGQVVEGTVTGVNKGGLELEVKSMRAFMPAGQVELFHVPDFTDYIGKRLQAEVTKFEREARNLVLSRRNILEKEKEAAREKTMAELAVDQVRRGTVRKVMDFGAFVDIGGVDGLLHVSELTFKRGRQSAADFVKEGDVVDVKVVRIDADTGKISLSLRQAHGIDPWGDAATKYAAGTLVTGRVARIEPFGAFIEIEEGVEGLLPISEMAYQRIVHPSDVVKVGDTVRLVVLSLDQAQRRMSFSLKQAGPDPWASAQDRFAVDMVVAGKVTRIADFGAFVELESGLEGLVHVSELTDQRIKTPADVVKIGQEVKVRILDVDKQARRISLSLKGVAELDFAKGSLSTTSARAGASVLPVAKPAAPADKGKKKKGPQLRGGLEF